LLPPGPSKTGATYVAQDAFGYSFLSDVFLASYAEGEKAWQAFLRPFADAKGAQEVFEKYRAEATSLEAKITKLESADADEVFVSENFGLIDVVFRKGNAVGGVNGATDPAAAREFALGFAKALPSKSPVLEASTAPSEGN
jgi:hypothetical protein